MASPAVEVDAGGIPVRVSNPDKIYFSARGETKLHLVEYVLAVGDGLVRALYERPCVLKRHPDGSDAAPIYQKRVPAKRPDWIETARVDFPSGRHADELCVRNVAAAVWATNLGTLDFHPWPSRRAATEYPDELRIDLDPQPGTGWSHVVETALEVNAVLTDLGLVGWPKTSGSKGIHIYVRVPPEHSFTAARRAALALGRAVERRRPDLATTAWWKEERGERVFVDYNRMARDQTIASAYSVRARPTATVSAPLSWDEVPQVEIEDFTIATMPARFARLGDVHAGMDDPAVIGSLEPLLEMADRDERDRGMGDAPYPPQFPKMPGEPMRVQPSRAKRPSSKNGT
jgi:DNA ligase D